MTPIEHWHVQHGSAEQIARRLGLDGPLPDGTWKGACPRCGGDDRFTLWDAGASRTGRVQGHCRSGCGLAGDALALAIVACGLDPDRREAVSRFLAGELRSGISAQHASPPAAPQRPARDINPRPLSAAARRLLVGLPVDLQRHVLQHHPEWEDAPPAQPDTTVDP